MDGSFNATAKAVLFNMVINDWAPGQTLIRFEDLINGGDKDYDDLAFSLANVQGSAIPEPTTLGLFALGLTSLGLRRRKK